MKNIKYLVAAIHYIMYIYLSNVQRTEVVDDIPWNMNLNDMLAPAISRIKGLLNLEDRFPWSKSATKKTSQAGPEESRRLENLQRADEEFDVEAFLKEKFPWRYGARTRR